MALTFSSAVVWASVHSQAAPQRKEVAASLRVAAAEALQWRTLEVEPGKRTSDLWSDSVGSFVKLDETRAARVGVPLAGRVVKVYVELGSDVKRGDPLFSVSSADMAMLGMERRKAALDLDEAEAKLNRVRAIVEAHALPERELFDAIQQLRQCELSLQLAVVKQNRLSCTFSGRAAQQNAA